MEDAVTFVVVVGVVLVGSGVLVHAMMLCVVGEAMGVVSNPEYDDYGGSGNAMCFFLWCCLV